jgi:hypothetical protein
MKRTRKAYWLGSLALLIGVSVSLPLLGAKKPGGGGGGGVNDAARFTITDNPYYLLSSDGKGTYADWRLPDGDPCVFGWVDNGGGFFAYLSRGNEHGDDCQQYYPEEQWRTYSLTFPAGTGICPALGLGDDNQPCLLVADDMPRISFGLFAARTEESAGRVMFYLNGKSYQLECAGDVSGSGTTRTVSNTTRTAVLWLIGGKKPQQIGAAFVFPFELTVERVPL